MGRLVDADSLIYKLDKRRTYESEIRNKAYGKGVRDAMKDIDAAPTIDAIPVEYLMKYAQLPTEFAIATWRKQDKNAQEKRIKRLDKPMPIDDALNLVNDVFPLGQKEQEAR